LHTLKIKETDRLVALQIEISKLGGDISVSADSLTLASQRTPLTERVAIATYHDHRMAMAFAPLALKVPLLIKDAGVVSKSYPDFWKDLETLGFETEAIIIA
jgi:3-phosphoshikimate 1-carboxyvinyltransferase